MVFTIILLIALPGFCQTSTSFCKDFKRVAIAPSSSCHKVTKPTPNIGNCFQSCIESVGLLYMVSQHVITNECFCCQLPLSQSEGEPGEWRSFVRRCPDRYSRFVLGATETCLRFDSTLATYHDASLQCQSEDGDLVRIETPDMIPLLKDLFYTGTDKEYYMDYYMDYYILKYPWVQGIRDNASVWRYHDGSQMPDIMTNYLNNSYDYGDYLILDLYDGYIFSDIPDYSLPFICEYRFN